MWCLVAVSVALDRTTSGIDVDRGLNAAQAGHLRLAAAAPNVSGSEPAARPGPDAILDERYAKNASGSGSANASANESGSGPAARSRPDPAIEERKNASGAVKLAAADVSQPTISPLSEKPTASPLSEKDQIASEIASKIAANAAHRRSLEGVTPSTETAPAFVLATRPSDLTAAEILFLLQQKEDAVDHEDYKKAQTLKDQIADAPKSERDDALQMLFTQKATAALVKDRSKVESIQRQISALILMDGKGDYAQDHRPRSYRRLGGVGADATDVAEWKAAAANAAPVNDAVTLVDKGVHTTGSGDAGAAVSATGIGGAAASAASSGGAAASTARLPPHAIAFEAQMVAQLGRSGLLVINVLVLSMGLLHYRLSSQAKVGSVDALWYGACVVSALAFIFALRHHASAQGVKDISSTKIVGFALSLQLIYSMTYCSLSHVHSNTVFQELWGNFGVLSVCTIPGIFDTFSKLIVVFCVARMDAGTFFVVYSLRTVCVALFNRGLNILGPPQKLTSASAWCLGIIACGVSAYLICSPVASIVKSPKPWHLVFYAALSALYSAISIQTEGHLKENFVDFHMQGIWSAISGLLAVFVLGRTVWGLDEEIEVGQTSTWASLDLSLFLPTLLLAVHGIAAAQVVRRLDSSWVEAELASVLVLAVMVESIFFHGTYALPAIYGITAVYMGIAGLILDRMERRAELGKD